jgi:hypothetical protein
MTRIPILLLAVLMASPMDAARPRPGKLAQTKPDGTKVAATQPAAAGAALLAVLKVERQSKAYYAAVLNKHRPIHPFGMVYRMEGRHEQQVTGALKNLSITVPPDAADAKAINVPADKAAARAKAVGLEKKTVAAYDAAIKTTKDAQLRETLKRLRAESVDHQKWFADPSTCPMGGRGQGKGQGQGAGKRGPRG